MLPILQPQLNSNSSLIPHLAGRSCSPYKIPSDGPQHEPQHQNDPGKFCQRRFGWLNRFLRSVLLPQSNPLSTHCRILHQQWQRCCLWQSCRKVSPLFYNRSDREGEVFMCKEYLHYKHRNLRSRLWQSRNWIQVANSLLPRSFPSWQWEPQMLLEPGH